MHRTLNYLQCKPIYVNMTQSEQLYIMIMMMFTKRESPKRLELMSHLKPKVTDLFQNLTILYLNLTKALFHINHVLEMMCVV